LTLDSLPSLEGLDLDSIPVHGNAAIARRYEHVLGAVIALDETVAGRMDANTAHNQGSLGLRWRVALARPLHSAWRGHPPRAGRRRFAFRLVRAAARAARGFFCQNCLPLVPWGARVAPCGAILARAALDRRPQHRWSRRVPRPAAH